MDMFLIAKILDLANVQNYMRCLSQNKSDTIEYFCSVSSRLRDHGLSLRSLPSLAPFARSLRSLNREVSDKYTVTITYNLIFVNN